MQQEFIHHESRTLPADSWRKPWVVAWTDAGGVPHSREFHKLKDAGALCFRLEGEGAITCSVDGLALW